MIHEITHVIGIHGCLFQKVFDGKEGVIDVRLIVINMEVGSCLDLMNPLFMSIMQFLQILK